jgi:hypothetical protein
VFYMVLETAKLVGADPAQYLHDAARADARAEVLLPWDAVPLPSARVLGDFTSPSARGRVTLVS